MVISSRSDRPIKRTIIKNVAVHLKLWRAINHHLVWEGVGYVVGHFQYLQISDILANLSSTWDCYKSILSCFVSFLDIYTLKYKQRYIFILPATYVALTSTKDNVISINKGY